MSRARASLARQKALLAARQARKRGGSPRRLPPIRVVPTIPVEPAMDSRQTTEPIPDVVRAFFDSASSSDDDEGRINNREDEDTSLLAATRLTLAEQLGLVPVRSDLRAGNQTRGRERELLSAEQWDEVRAAHGARGVESCAICLESYAIQPQVLLSCSHSFHAECLTAFEAHARAAAAEPDAPVVPDPVGCPLCRKTHYAKKQIRDGGRAYILAATVRIQAWWRGISARTAYKDLRLSRPPPASGPRRTVWYQDKLAVTTDALLSHVDASTAEVDELFALIDARQSQDPSLENASHQHLPPPVLTPSEWEDVYHSAVIRGADACTICLGPLEAPGRTPALLSCSHTFHDACIASFESFTLHKTPTCPICRSVYTRTSPPAHRSQYT